MPPRGAAGRHRARRLRPYTLALLKSRDGVDVADAGTEANGARSIGEARRTVLFDVHHRATAGVEGGTGGDHEWCIGCGNGRLDHGLGKEPRAESAVGIGDFDPDPCGSADGIEGGVDKGHPSLKRLSG